MAEKSLKQIYRDAVVNVAEPAVFFIDPGRMTNDPDYNAREVGRQFKAQFPNEKGMDPDNPEHMEFAKNLAASQKGPSVGPNASAPRERPFGAGKCFVTEPGTGWETKQKIVSRISGIPEAHLREAPGTTADYIEQTAEHEGEHCNQRHAHNELEVIRGEVGAEQRSYRGLEARGKLDVLDTVKKAAITNAAHDIEHATTIRLKPDGAVDENDYHKVRDVKNFIYLGAAETKGIKTESQLSTMEQGQPGLYNNLIKSMIKEGVYDDVPEQKTKIQEYVDAREALMKPAEQLVDAKPAVAPAASAPKTGA